MRVAAAGAQVDPLYALRGKSSPSGLLLSPVEARSLTSMDRAAPVSVPAEVAIFVTRRRGQEVLLLLRMPSGGGYWHVVAGAIEAGETPQEAAKRELWEETGLLAQLEPCLEVVEVCDSRRKAGDWAVIDPAVGGRAHHVLRHFCAGRVGADAQRGARLS